jgi:hypothetical protein
MTIESLDTVRGRWLAADARARTVERMFRPLLEERDALDAKLAALETSLRGCRQEEFQHRQAVLRWQPFPPPAPLDPPAT